MTPMSRLGRQIAEVTAALNSIGVQFALIGGLALASHRVVRDTLDMAEIREYFRLFERESLLDEILRQID